MLGIKLTSAKHNSTTELHTESTHILINYHSHVCGFFFDGFGNEETQLMGISFNILPQLRSEEHTSELQSQR